MQKFHFRLFLLASGSALFALIGLSRLMRPWSETSLGEWFQIGLLALGLFFCLWLGTRWLAHWCLSPIFSQFVLASENDDDPIPEPSIPEVQELKFLRNHFKYMTSHLNAKEQELQEKHLQIEEAQSIKTNFVRNMSNELRTPINSVLGISEALMLQDLPEGPKQLVQIIYFSAHDLLQMTTNLLKLAEMDSGRIRNDPQWVEFQPLVNSVLREVLSTVDQALFRLETQWGERLPEQLFIDTLHFKQMLFTLLRTALKLTKGGTLTLSIHLKEVNFVSISLHDPGVQLSTDALRSVFERFHTEGNQDGDIGISLALTRELAEFQGGSAEGESVSEEGTRFWFTLPLNQTLEMKSDWSADMLPNLE